MGVVDSAQFIHLNSSQVHINLQQIQKVGDWIRDQMLVQDYDKKKWSTHELHPVVEIGKEELVVNWIFTVDLLNFSFWTGDKEPEFIVLGEGKEYKGYWTLCAVVNKSEIHLKQDKWDSLTIQELKEMFKGDKGEMPMLEDRLKILKETGKILKEKFNGSVIQLVRRAENSSLKLIEILKTEFGEIWDDSGVFKARRVEFMKRAQIFCGDLWAALDGKGYGEFHDIDKITIFADYRIPQALVSLNILQYSEKALKEIKDTILKHNSELEMEIRGNSIYAVCLIEKYLREKYPGQEINAILIDFYIWDFITKDRRKFENIAFHKTRSIYY